MPETTPLFFVEPVARGYRLDVLASAISAVREYSSRPVYVVTREDFVSRELARRIEPSWHDVHFVASTLALGGTSVGMHGHEGTRALLDAVARVTPCDGAMDMVFFGADDCLGSLAAQLPSYVNRPGRTHSFVILYNSDDLIAGQLSKPGMARAGREAVAALEDMDATLFSFDEALRGKRIGWRDVCVLPDPWHGHFSHAQRKLARETWKIPRNGLLVTAEIEWLLDMHEDAWATVPMRLATLPAVHFVLLGNVWALRSSRLKELVTKLGQRMMYAGPVLDAERDIKLIAATDLMLSSGIPARCASAHPGVAEKTRTSATRRVRSAALGASFDRDVRRTLLHSMEGLLAISDVGMTIVRDELDRLAHERLMRSFGAQLRAALRRAR